MESDVRRKETDSDVGGVRVKKVWRRRKEEKRGGGWGSRISHPTGRFPRKKEREKKKEDCERDEDFFFAKLTFISKPEEVFF